MGKKKKKIRLENVTGKWKAKNRKNVGKKKKRCRRNPKRVLAVCVKVISLDLAAPSLYNL